MSTARQVKNIVESMISQGSTKEEIVNKVSELVDEETADLIVSFYFCYKP